MIRPSASRSLRGFSFLEVMVALAMLLSFLLDPLVGVFERLRMKRVVASAVTVVLAASAIFALGWAVYRQLEDLSDSLPGYQENIRRKIDPLRGENPVEKIDAPPLTTTPLLVLPSPVPPCPVIEMSPSMLMTFVVEPSNTPVLPPPPAPPVPSIVIVAALDPVPVEPIMLMPLA